jgi:hypothetical protein
MVKKPRPLQKPQINKKQLLLRTKA